MTFHSWTSTHSTPGHSTPMLLQLDREWTRLRRRPEALAAVRSWSGTPGFAAAVATASSLDDVVAATQATPHDAVTPALLLARLVDVATTNDLAARIVLQRLLPGLISQSRRWRGNDLFAEPTDLAIGAAWIAIRKFDVERRTPQVGPALIRDALWIAFRMPLRRRGSSEIPMDASELGEAPARTDELDPMVALAGTMRAATLAGVEPAQLDVIRNIARAGSPSQAARDQQVTVRTIRNRRDHATRCVRDALGADWLDWTDPVVAA